MKSNPLVRRIGLTLLMLLGVLLLVFYAMAFWPLRDPHPTATLPRGALAIRGAKIYTSPDVEPLEQATIVIRDGVIAALGPDIAIPGDARLLPCDRCVVTAGFWNTHVHFTEDHWSSAEFKSARTLDAQLADMLTSRGFTTVVDTGSDLRVTIALRRRIEYGELTGPKIYTAGSPQYPPHGIPYYVRESTPGWIQRIMLQPATPAAAAQDEERNISRGADILKLFTGAYVSRDVILPMPEANAVAAAAVAHAHGQLVFSHPSNLAGVLVAIHSGVDVLAHAPDTPGGIDTAVLQSIVDRHMAMIPTLKLFATMVTKDPAYLTPIYDEVRQFHTLGGDLMFGTDVGFMPDYDTADEFAALALSGLNAMDILRMLTTVPARRFGVQDVRGSLAVGRAADLVVLGDDPSAQVAAFANVRATIRDGRVIYGPV